MRAIGTSLVLACAACAGAPEPPTPAPAPPQPKAAPAPIADSAAQTDVETLADAASESASAAAALYDSGTAGDAPSTLAASDDAGNAPLCPAGEVWVPPTPAEGFLMSKGQPREHRVVLSHGFCMDANEVSVRAFSRCVDAGACKEPWPSDPFSMYPSKPDYPVNLVSWVKARAYCAWAGKRLPTEAEWEWAATGPTQTKYPWGNEPEPSCEYVDYTKYGAPKWLAGADVGCGGGGPSPVGSHPKGDKVWPGGAIHDLAGNVWEWVEDSFAPLAKDTQTDPLFRSQSESHVIRGGGWNRSYAAMVVTFRGAADVDYQVPALGFRCVRGEKLKQ
jgi:formylglycine-generating enzyme required for sulfatase activity